VCQSYRVLKVCKNSIESRDFERTVSPDIIIENIDARREHDCRVALHPSFHLRLRHERLLLSMIRVHVYVLESKYSYVLCLSKHKTVTLVYRNSKCFKSLPHKTVS
jgi:hypothetical protein